jgi:hypothetical protein
MNLKINKLGWRKFIEAQIGREFTDIEWKMMRYKVIYVVATKDKDRIPETQLIKIVSDEDGAIIGAVRVVFPKVSHAFCVFHQMENVTKKYADEFKHKDDIPVQDLEIYETANELIKAENAIVSTILYRRIINLAKNTGLLEASRKVIKYINKIFLIIYLHFLIKDHSTLENGKVILRLKEQKPYTFNLFVNPFI